jgi:(E)-4-hydroxy-3-methylbut-2-enyl-diphosphate synthase
LKAKELNRAIRIGTNHGSLSARVMSYWGDSPKGMVESAVEFAKLCRKYDFHNFLFSMKVNSYGIISHEIVMLPRALLLYAEDLAFGVSLSTFL